MDLRDDAGLGQAEQVVVSFHVAVPVFEAFSTVILFTQLVLLDHSAHGAVDHKDTFIQFFPYILHIRLYFCLGTEQSKRLGNREEGVSLAFISSVFAQAEQ